MDIVLGVVHVLTIGIPVLRCLRAGSVFPYFRNGRASSARRYGPPPLTRMTWQMPLPSFANWPSAVRVRAVRIALQDISGLHPQDITEVFEAVLGCKLGLLSEAVMIRDEWSGL